MTSEHIKSNQGVLICFTVGGFENLTSVSAVTSPRASDSGVQVKGLLEGSWNPSPLRSPSREKRQLDFA